MQRGEGLGAEREGRIADEAGRRHGAASETASSSRRVRVRTIGAIPPSRPVKMVGRPVPLLYRGRDEVARDEG